MSSNEATKIVVSNTDVLSGAISPNSDVWVQGWVRSVRTSRAGIAFLHISDGSCFDSLQIVVDSDIKNFSEITGLTTGTSVTILGQVVESRGQGQDWELQASRVDIIGEVANPDTYPVSKKRHSFEFLRTVAHLRPRTNTFGAIARVRHALSMAIHDFFSQNGFVWVNTPIITASDCEGAGDLFRVSTLSLVNANQKTYDDDFFGRETYLSVSGQLNVEAYCLAMTKVYTFGPTFRAENSNTTRHLAEFWMIEPEIAFANLHDNIQLAESFLKSVIKKVTESVPDEFDFFARHIDSEVTQRIENVLSSAFVRMEYTDAIQELQRSNQDFQYPVEWGLDLQTEHEKYLTTLTNSPVVVVNYPSDIKAFYMRLNDDGKTVAAMDVLVPGVGEIIGGSQREERLDVLDQRMDHTIQEELWWYRDLRKYGTVPHAGFGVGFERLLMYLTGMDNIRDVIPFPRTPQHAPF